MDKDAAKSETSYIRVEAERIDRESRRFNSSPPPQYIIPRPPVWATWLLLFLAWLFLGSSIPFTVLIGLPLNLAALFLSLICLTRGGVITGMLGLVLGTIGSFIVYLTGLFMFLGKL